MLNKSCCKSCCKCFLFQPKFLDYCNKKKQPKNNRQLKTIQLFFSETNNETYSTYAVFFFNQANANEHEVIPDKLFLQNQDWVPASPFFPAIFFNWFTPSPRELPALVRSVYFPFLIAGPALPPKTAALPNQQLQWEPSSHPRPPVEAFALPPALKSVRNAFHRADSATAGVGMLHICVAQ